MILVKSVFIDEHKSMIESPLLGICHITSDVVCSRPTGHVPMSYVALCMIECSMVVAFLV